MKISHRFAPALKLDTQSKAPAASAMDKQIVRSPTSPLTALKSFKGTVELIALVCNYLPPKDRECAAIAFYMPPHLIAKNFAAPDRQNFLRHPATRLLLERSALRSIAIPRSDTDPDEQVMSAAKFAPYCSRNRIVQDELLARVFDFLDRAAISGREDPTLTLAPADTDSTSQQSVSVKEKQRADLDILMYLANGLSNRGDFSDFDIDRILLRLVIHFDDMTIRGGCFPKNSDLVSALAIGVGNNVFNAQQIERVIRLLDGLIEGVSDEALTEVVIGLSKTLSRTAIAGGRKKSAVDLIDGAVRNMSHATSSGAIAEAISEIDFAAEHSDANDAERLIMAAISHAFDHRPRSADRVSRMIALLPENLAGAMCMHLAQSLEDGRFFAQETGSRNVLEAIKLLSPHCSSDARGRTVLALAVALYAEKIPAACHALTLDVMLASAPVAGCREFAEANRFMTNAVQDARIACNPRVFTVLGRLARGASEYRQLDYIAYSFRQILNPNTEKSAKEIEALCLSLLKSIENLPQSSRQDEIDTRVGELTRALKKNRHARAQCHAISAVLLGLGEKISPRYLDMLIDELVQLQSRETLVDSSHQNISELINRLQLRPGNRRSVGPGTSSNMSKGSSSRPEARYDE